MAMTSIPVFTSAGIKELDTQLERADLLELAMEEAGRAVADCLQEMWPIGKVLLIVGGGANGGDALVAARHLLGMGREVAVWTIASQHPLTLRNAQRLQACGVYWVSSLEMGLEQADVVVDGLLGTGFVPPLRPEMHEIIELINAAQKPVLSIDFPSGLHADSAEKQLSAIRATHSVVLSGHKTATLFGPAASQCGTVQVASLRCPPTWHQDSAIANLPSGAQLWEMAPERPLHAHKGVAGHVWVIGGLPSMQGAPLLAAKAALRAGAGLVSVHSAAELPLQMPELMIHRHKNLSRALHELTSRPTALCVGMGLGPQALSMAKYLLTWQVPSVIDADALQAQLQGKGHADCIWTPHPKEAARMLDISPAEVVRSPLETAQRLQERFGGVVVLKGGPTTIASDNGLWVSRGGHAGMASAGMGDTLSGILAALLGQGLSAEQAALFGVHWHALAGELAAEQHGYGLQASDLSELLGAAWQTLKARASLPTNATPPH